MGWFANLKLFLFPPASNRKFSVGVDVNFMNLPNNFFTNATIFLYALTYVPKENKVKAAIKDNLVAFFVNVFNNYLEQNPQFLPESREVVVEVAVVPLFPLNERTLRAIVNNPDLIEKTSSIHFEIPESQNYGKVKLFLDASIAAIFFQFHVAKNYKDFFDLLESRILVDIHEYYAGSEPQSEEGLVTVPKKGIKRQPSTRKLPFMQMKQSPPMKKPFRARRRV